MDKPLLLVGPEQEVLEVEEGSMRLIDEEGCIGGCCSESINSLQNSHELIGKLNPIADTKKLESTSLFGALCIDNVPSSALRSYW